MRISRWRTSKKQEEAWVWIDGGGNIEKPLLEHKQLPVFPIVQDARMHICNAKMEEFLSNRSSLCFCWFFAVVSIMPCFAFLFPSPILSPFSPSFSPFLLHSTRLLHCNC